MNKRSRLKYIKLYVHCQVEFEKISHFCIRFHRIDAEIEGEHVFL